MTEFFFTGPHYDRLHCRAENAVGGTVKSKVYYVALWTTALLPTAKMVIEPPFWGPGNKYFVTFGGPEALGDTAAGGILTIARAQLALVRGQPQSKLIS